MKSVALRGYNLRLEGFAEQRLGASKGLTWKDIIEDLTQPWVAVAIPDAKLEQGVDVTGVSSKYAGRWSVPPQSAGREGRRAARRSRRTRELCAFGSGIEWEGCFSRCGVSCRGPVFQTR